jgi:tRNA dimethylallyltransferase
MIRLQVVVGATASGKSAFGMQYANQHNGEIVSADSMQIYRRLDIGTAKPTMQDRLDVPHHCIDIVDPNCSYSVAEWVNCADDAIRHIVDRGRVPIILGGTGLYIKALLYSHRFGDTDPALRLQLQTQLRQLGKYQMHAQLQQVDSISALNINPNDTKRVLRALEIYYTTGVPKSQYNDNSLVKRYEYDLHVMDIDRETLYNRINIRVDDMLSQGLLTEVKQLMQYKDCQSMQGIGYRQLVDYCQGNVDWQTSVYLIKQYTRNYAKRQLTFFRHFNAHDKTMH